ncbi:MAG: hypothetical protein IPI30_16895 [Saprospiraceae bacterium]|nr:hypothetical protein [Candidatus Vicinibacter affinis]
MNECEEYLRSGHIKPLKNLNRFPSNVQTIEYDHIHAYNQVGFNRPQNSEIFGFTKSWNFTKLPGVESSFRSQK